MALCRDHLTYKYLPSQGDKLRPGMIDTLTSVRLTGERENGQRCDKPLHLAPRLTCQSPRPICASGNAGNPPQPTMATPTTGQGLRHRPMSACGSEANRENRPWADWPSYLFILA